MRTLSIDTAEVFEPLLVPHRYKGARGGRGSGKSHFFAESLIEDALCFPGDAGVGLRAVGIREVQKTLKESSKRLIEDKIQAFGLTERDGFRVYNEVIATPGDGLIVFQGMQDHNAESIKSLEGYQRCWVEEAQTLSGRSLSLLRPTIRWEDTGRGLASELWFSWNPRKKTDAVDAMFRSGEPPTGSICVAANWRDNPRFPQVLEDERLDCLKNTPEQYDHIWEGGYATVLEGAYYARAINDARRAGRIGRVSADELMSVRLFWDIGGTGAKADAVAIWALQFIGKEIRAVNYYEAVGQPLATHVNWMRDQGYAPKRAQIWLPHDGDTQDKVHDVSYASYLRGLNYDVTVVPNQGKGAAKQRIEAGRKHFSSVWFNEDACRAGLEALGWYHERKDEERGIGLGPEHDWSSHGADAFGLAAVCADKIFGESQGWGGKIRYDNRGIV